MGARGPAPVPTEILKARGSTLANRNPREPVPEPGAPPCPRSFTKPEKALWKRLVKTLLDMRVATKADWPQLERYCRMAVQYEKGQAFLARMAEKHGDQVPPNCYPVWRNEDDPNDTGNYVLPAGNSRFLAGYLEYPTFRQLAALDKSMRAIEANFGLNPSARTRIWATEENGPKLHDGADDRNPEVYFFGGVRG